jgi:hypothetical protein
MADRAEKGGYISGDVTVSEMSAPEGLFRPGPGATVPIRPRTAAGSLEYLAKLLEDSAEDDSPTELRARARQVAFTLRVLAMGDGNA